MLHESIKSCTKLVESRLVIVETRLELRELKLVCLLSLGLNRLESRDHCEEVCGMRWRKGEGEKEGIGVRET